MISIDDVTIDSEFESLLAPLSADELNGLKESVVKEGFTDPIIVWLGRGILVDGHNRFSIWRDELDADEDRAPDIREVSFSSRDEVREYILRRQLSRRNLTDAMRVRLNLLLKPVLAAKAKEKCVDGGKTKGLQNSVNPSEPLNTQKEIAKASGVSHDTVYKVEKVLENATTQVRDAMLDGSISVRKAFQTVHTPKCDREEEASGDMPNDLEPEAQLPQKTIGVGLERAHEAIARLRSIPANDPLRIRAFETVADWIKVNKQIKD